MYSAIQVDPNNSAVMMNIGSAYLGHEKYDVSYCRDLVEIVEIKAVARNGFGKRP